MDEFHYAYDPRDCHLPYLNITAFTARCLQAGIHEVFPPFPDNAYNHFWYAQNVLNRNLNIPNYEEPNRRLTERRRTGAALYIIFAGEACFEHLVLDEAVRGKGKRLWPLWMKVFEEIVEGRDPDSDAAQSPSSGLPPRLLPTAADGRGPAALRGAERRSEPAPSASVAAATTPPTSSVTSHSGHVWRPRAGDSSRDRQVLEELREVSTQALEKMRMLWAALEKEEKDSAFEASYGNGYRQYHDSHDRHDTVH
ncbi:hypothetical protein KEM52_001591 [Ascosphaera acerosa]|nr:hypothetical protein KEM52_001591 [Ascosphaera acerosa]